MRGDRGGFAPRSFAPVKVGEELDVKIESVGEKGDGVAKIKGFVLFVPNTKEGDEVKVRVTKVFRKMGFADVVGEATGSVSSEDQEPSEEAEKEPEEEAPQDTEDFGEEPEEEKEEKE